MMLIVLGKNDPPIVETWLWACIPICTHSQTARLFIYLSLFIFKAVGYCLCLTVVGKYMCKLTMAVCTTIEYI